MTKPSEKTLEESFTEVMALESKPPVHDSQTEIVIFFSINFLTIFSDKKYILKANKFYKKR